MADPKDGSDREEDAIMGGESLCFACFSILIDVHVHLRAMK